MQQRGHMVSTDLRRGLSSMLPQRALVEKVFGFIDQERIIPLLKRHASFAADDAGQLLAAELNCLPYDRTRLRMIETLLDLLWESGMVQKNGTVYSVPDSVFFPDLLDRDDRELLREAFTGQNAFFEKCAANLPSFLRGRGAAVRFDASSSACWHQFLDNEEYAYARAILGGLLIRNRKTPLRLLDLCCGTGAGARIIRRMWPDVSVAVIDAYDFADIARTIAHDASIVWDASLRWQGFGDPLPFSDGAFDLVFFACADPYIPESLRETVYADIFRILSPGGSLGILSRSLPDQMGQYVQNPWMRKAALAHDFLESVCDGWHGFSDPHQSAELFARIGYSIDRIMLDATIWKLDKPIKEQF